MSQVAVVSAADAAAADRATTAAGVPARALMQRAGAAAAAEIARRFPHALGGAVAVYAGPGNNGGDAWVVAAALRRVGVTVRAVLVGGDAPRTDDARGEWTRALAEGPFETPNGSERLVIDGVLGTGARGAMAPFAVAAVHRMRAARDASSIVVALDVPTGIDATTGATLGEVALAADLTLTFGTLKRGLLVARGHAGAIAVLDIGLDALGADTSRLVAARDVARAAPPIAADAHKGTRGKLAIVGGAPGMAGAALLAARAALHGGVGMVRVVVAPESVPVAQVALTAAMASPWPADDDALSRELVEWADVVVLGPGLGRTPDSRALCERVLRAWRGPVVLDADALTLFERDAERLGALLDGRPALLTPHPLEFARLAGVTLDDVLARRFDVGRELASRVHAAVLLKGVPTIVTDDRATLVSATGTPALATAGSGDVLAGLCGALLAHLPNGASAAERGAAAAWAHGRAAEIATAQRGGVRGTTLDDVIVALPEVWREVEQATRTCTPYPILCELPAVPG